MLSLSVLATSNESLVSGVHPIRSAYLRNMLVAYGELKISCAGQRHASAQWCVLAESEPAPAEVGVAVPAARPRPASCPPYRP